MSPVAELLGFEALASDRHPSAAVALEEFHALGQRLPALNRHVHRALSVALTRRGELAEVMAAPWRPKCGSRASCCSCRDAWRIVASRRGISICA